MRDVILLYDGALKANRVSSVVRLDQTFDIIRPGFDAQGRRRTSWTQIVHEGVPVFEVKVLTDLDNVLDKFERQFDRDIGQDADLLTQALAQVKRERRAKFRDGVSGVEPAPAPQDKRQPPRKYPS